MSEQFTATPGQFTCETCGKPILFAYFPTDPEFAKVIHTGCDTPRVSMITDNPRRLGIVTSIAE